MQAKIVFYADYGSRVGLKFENMEGLYYCWKNQNPDIAKKQHNDIISFNFEEKHGKNRKMYKNVVLIKANENIMDVLKPKGGKQ